MSSLHRRCPNCHSGSASEAVESSGNMEGSSAVRGGLSVRRRKSRPIFVAAMLALMVVVGLAWRQWGSLDLRDANLRNKINASYQEMRIALAPTPDNCGTMAPIECRWASEANRILKISLAIEDREGEPLTSRLSRLSDSLSQSKADYLRLPPVPERCFLTKSLLSRALSEAKTSVTLAKRAIEENVKGAQHTKDTVKEANLHRQRAGELYKACAAELEQLFKPPA